MTGDDGLLKGKNTSPNVTGIAFQTMEGFNVMHSVFYHILTVP